MEQEFCLHSVRTVVRKPVLLFPRRLWMIKVSRCSKGQCSSLWKKKKKIYWYLLNGQELCPGKEDSMPKAAVFGNSSGAKPSYFC